MHLILTFVQNCQDCLGKFDRSSKLFTNDFQASNKCRDTTNRAAKSMSAAQNNSFLRATHKVVWIKKSSPITWQMGSFNIRSPETSRPTSSLTWMWNEDHIQQSWWFHTLWNQWQQVQAALLWCSGSMLHIEAPPSFSSSARKKTGQIHSDAISPGNW